MGKPAKRVIEELIDNDTFIYKYSKNNKKNINREFYDVLLSKGDVNKILIALKNITLAPIDVFKYVINTNLNKEQIKIKHVWFDKQENRRAG